MKNLLSMEEVAASDIVSLITRAIDIKNGSPMMSLSDKTVVNLFYENSTRTKVSFEMAEKKLNLTQLPFDVATSSVSKGESLYDTCKTLEAIGADALVIRHPDNKYDSKLQFFYNQIIYKSASSCTQSNYSLLDIMTNYEKLGKLTC